MIPNININNTYYFGEYNYIFQIIENDLLEEPEIKKDIFCTNSHNFGFIRLKDTNEKFFRFLTHLDSDGFPSGYTLCFENIDNVTYSLRCDYNNHFQTKFEKTCQDGFHHISFNEYKEEFDKHIKMIYRQLEQIQIIKDKYNI